jgi:hypothetical protein
MQKPLKYNQNIAKDQQEAFQNHWCVDAELGLEMLDAILLELHQEGTLDRDEYKALHSKYGVDDE